METMFAAALLIVIALAVLSSMDVASRTSAANKGRTVASSLAEQDQERMRGMTVDKLSQYTDASDVTVAGASYHIESRGEWWGDSTSKPLSCSTDSKANYIRISSTVTSNVVGKDTKPVVMRGLVAPPVSANSTRGTLAIKVKDRNGDPVPNMPVTLSGTAALSATTNALGCAIFAYIPAGAGTNYTATLNVTDWVDQDDKQISTISPNVAAGDVTLQEMTYDREGSVKVDFRDSAGQPASPTPTNLSVSNSSWITPSPTRRVTGATATDLFPFTTSAYTLYAGSCDSGNPTSYAAAQDPDEVAASALVLPAQETSGVIVRVPTVSLKVVDSFGVGTAGQVSLRATGTGCTEAVDRQPTASDGTFSIDLPYGRYKVCSAAGGKVKSEYINNYTAGGTATIPLKPSNGGITGSQCSAPLPLP